METRQSGHGITNKDTGALLVQETEGALVLDACDAVTGWALVGDATTGNGLADILAVADGHEHVYGTESLEINKIDGTNITEACIAKTLTSFSANEYLGDAGGYIIWNLYVSSLSDVAHAFIRLGTSVSHYNEWIVLDANLVTGWNTLCVPLSSPYAAGNTGDGWDSDAIVYLSVGVEFDGEANELADIRIDRIMLSLTPALTGGGADLFGNVGLLNKAETEIDPAESHAEDSAHVSGDMGTMPLAVRKDDVHATAHADTDGDYAPVTTNEHDILRTQAQQHFGLDECNSVEGWAAVGDATTGNGDASALATDVNHVYGTASIEFNKVNGSGPTEATIARTITSIDLDVYHKGGGIIVMSLYVSSVADIKWAFVRLGTDATDYNEWRIDDDQLTEGEWNLLRFPMMSPSYDGNEAGGDGWNSAAVVYLAVGVEFDAEDDELADIKVDHIAVNTGLRTTADITAEITSEVATPNVNVHKVGNKPVTTGAGDVGNETSAKTQRTTLATNDVNAAAINVAVKDRDEVISTMSRLTVGSTAVITALGATVTSIMLIPEDSTVDIRMNIGAATAATPRIPATGVVIPCTKTVGDTIQVYSAAEQFLTLITFVPRN